MAGEREADPTRNSWLTIKGYEKDDQLKMIVATLDLTRHPSPHYWGGPMRSAPGGQRVRHTVIRSLEDQIAEEAKRWWGD